MLCQVSVKYSSFVDTTKSKIIAVFDTAKTNLSAAIDVPKTDLTECSVRVRSVVGTLSQTNQNAHKT